MVKQATSSSPLLTLVLCLGYALPSKAVPTSWVDTFFYHLSHKLHHLLDKAVLAACGSELGCSAEFKQIISRYHYKETLTCGPDKNSMNGLSECPRFTIGGVIRTMLHLAGLDLKFWNFAFHHFLRLYNIL
jgi:hypothetical protein